MALKSNLESIRLVSVLSCPQMLISIRYIDFTEIRCNLMHKFTFGRTFYHLPSKQITSVNPSSRYVTLYSLKFNYKEKVSSLLYDHPAFWVTLMKPQNDIVLPDSSHRTSQRAIIYEYRAMAE
jgi:hypothetical protein